MREKLSEQIPCDVKAGRGKSLHTPIPEGKPEL